MGTAQATQGTDRTRRTSSRKEASVEQDEIARRLAGARSAVLGTVGGRGRPHLVPIVFAHREGRLYTAVDRKPKTTRQLRRLINIEADPRVSVLVDHYDDDWSALWWIRLDGRAEVVRSGPRLRAGLALLAGKYEPYAAAPPPGPLIEIQIETTRAWSAG